MIAEAAVLCMALNAYHEARGQGIRGMLDVSQVVVNRTEAQDRRWPSETCRVVTQGGSHRRGRCQFSWYCDGRGDLPRDAVAWEQAVTVARAVLVGGARVHDLTEATCYHSTKIARPAWARGLRPVARRAGHVYYRC